MAPRPQIQPAMRVRRSRTFPLLKLPNELVLCIASKLVDEHRPRELSRLTRGCRRLHSLLEPVLLNLALTHTLRPAPGNNCSQTVPYWALEHSLPLLRKFLERGFPVNTGVAVTPWIPYNCRGKIKVHDKSLVVYASRSTRLLAGLKMLLEFGGDIDAAHAEIRGRSPWSYIFYFSLDMMRFMIESGCDVNRRWRIGRSALFFATYIKIYRLLKIEKVKLLLDAGADVNLVDEKGRTPLEYMMECWVKETMRLPLLKGRFDPDKIFPVVKLLLDRGATTDGVRYSVRKARQKKFFKLASTIEEGCGLKRSPKICDWLEGDCACWSTRKTKVEETAAI